MNGREIVVLAFFLAPMQLVAAHPIDELAPLTAPAGRAESLGFALSECPMIRGSSSVIDLERLGAPVVIARMIGQQFLEWQEYPVLKANKTTRSCSGLWARC